MTRITINSRDHGPQTFYVPEQGGYVRIEQGRNHGTLGRQICRGGGFSGATLTATPATLANVARAWWRAHLRSIA